jgi:superfamily I DNA and/or RNA helicase
MRCCETVVLFGDHKQLPASVSHEASLKGYDVSLFSRLAETIEPNLLTVQYRSHPMIMEFSSKLFYNGMLQNAVSPKHRIPPPGFPWNIDSKGNDLPVAFVNVDSYEVIQGSSKTNTKEARVVSDIVQDLLSANVPLDHIGVISPYSAQNKLLAKMLPSGVELNSVDAYQGREKEVIVFSATRANVRGNLGFVSDERRFNVMHTRAKRGLVVVGNRDTLKHDPLWKQWFEWIDENNMQVSF